MANRPLYWRAVLALWRSGLLRLKPQQLLGVMSELWRCRASLAALASVAAVRFPHRVALTDEHGALTYAELQRQFEHLAKVLQEGPQPLAGQQVALLSRNRRQFVVALLALARLGAHALVLSTESPAATLQKILNREGAILVLHDREFAEMLAVGLPEQRRLDLDDPLPDWALPPLPRCRRPGHLAVLTSGTTGVAKGIRHQPGLREVLPLMVALLERLPLRVHLPVVLAIPLFHGYGLATLAVSLAMGAPLHLARRPDIALLLARVAPEGPAVLVSIPTLLQRWLRGLAPDERPMVQAVITGSAPLDPRLGTQLMARTGPVLFNLYGSTEAGVIALATPEELLAAPGTVGRPLPNTLVSLRGSNGRTVALGETGQVWVRGPLVLQRDSQGWFNTGDLGRLDADGRLFICGRADAMLISGGENIYPYEPEGALLTHPGVADAAVLVLPDAEFGQRMVAFVVAKVAGQLTAVDLQAWLRERLERFKVPREIQIVLEIPRNALGKVDRAALGSCQAGRAGAESAEGQFQATIRPSGR